MTKIEALTNKNRIDLTINDLIYIESFEMMYNGQTRENAINALSKKYNIGTFAVSIQVNEAAQELNTITLSEQAADYIDQLNGLDLVNDLFIINDYDLFYDSVMNCADSIQFFGAGGLDDFRVKYNNIYLYNDPADIEIFTSFCDSFIKSLNKLLAI